MSNSRIKIWAPERQLSTLNIQNKNTPNDVVTIDLPSPKIEGWFTVQLLDANTKNIIEQHTFPNVITDNGMNAIGSKTFSPAIISSLQAGQGTSTPTGTDTSLASPLAGVANTGDSFGETYGSGTDGAGMTYWYARINRLFVESQANGNITELGWWNGSNASGDFCVRTLVRDSGGTPIVITKTSQNQLRVIYEYRLYPPTGSDVSGTISVGAQTYGYIIRPQNIFQEQGWGTGPFGFSQNGGTAFSMFQGYWRVQAHWTSDSWRTLVPPTSSSFDTSRYSNFSSVTSETYVGNSYQRDFNLILSPSVGTTQIRMIALKEWGSVTDSLTANIQPTWQIYFDPPFSKSNTEQLSLRFRSTWRRSKGVDT